MINKLKNKIFGILYISLSLLIIGIIIGVSVINYYEILDSVSKMMNSFTTTYEILDMGKDENAMEEIINGEYTLYTLIIENSEIVSSSENITDEIKNVALKVQDKNDDNSGIMGKYIYKIRKVGDSSYTIKIMEDKEVIRNINIIKFFAIILTIITLIAMYLLSKEISQIIVKPVEETIARQKQFISDASHELKTPLSIIEINAEMEEKKLGNNKWNTYIQEEAQNMNQLINEMLLLAKTENVQNIKKYEKINLSNEIELIISTFEIMTNEKNINLETKIVPNLNINGSTEDIKHILSPLIDNAIKHTDIGKNISIELSKEKEQFIIQVKNEGDEIPLQEREKIFERFYRIDKSRNRNEKRYGLGLAIAKSIVEKYNGTIEVICKNGITNFKVKINSI